MCLYDELFESLIDTSSIYVLPETCVFIFWKEQMIKLDPMTETMSSRPEEEVYYLAMKVRNECYPVLDTETRESVCRTIAFYSIKAILDEQDDMPSKRDDLEKAYSHS